MSVTYEQGDLLGKFGVAERAMEHAIDVLRAVGVRRANVLKNTGSRQYAFNIIQKQCLPYEFRPPHACYGGNVS